LSWLDRRRLLEVEELRIGAFICRCGTNIGGFLDVPAIVEYAKTLPHVVFARENLFSCSETGTADIKNAIKEHRLNRVVVAACTPRTHEPTFRAACEEAGLNPFLFEFVNIREHCSWVHKSEGEKATQKAKDLVRMGVARAAALEPKQYIVAPVNPSALVIGGGISGLTACSSLADRGFKVILVEKEDELGGRLRDLYKLYPSNIDASEILKKKIKEVKEHPQVEVFVSSEIKSVKGYIGNYDVTLKKREQEDTTPGAEYNRKVGVIIIATGTDSFIPEGLYNYDGKKIITQLELEKRLREEKDIHANNIIMILCVGSRIKERIYCSRICCMVAIKNAILFKEVNPASNVYILYRDLQSYGTHNEAYLRKAKEAGIRFINYSLDNPPSIDEERLRVYNNILGRELSIEYDLIVLTTPMVPRQEAKELSKMLKVPLDENDFFLEAHVKLRPVDFATDGIYVCGTAHWPASTEESIFQALGAASRASIHLTREQVKVEPIVSALEDEEACRGCGLCAYHCPYNAIEIIETEKGKKARMIEVACKGCGVCASTCYRRAIKMNHFTDEQIKTQINAYLRG